MNTAFLPDNLGGTSIHPANTASLIGFGYLGPHHGSFTHLGFSLVGLGIFEFFRGLGGRGVVTVACEQFVGGSVFTGGIGDFFVAEGTVGRDGR